MALQDDRYTDRDVHEGEKLLARIVADLARDGVHLHPPLPLGHPLDYMSGHNLRALILQRRNGGWVADVLFRTVPEGFPEVHGTRDAYPLPDQEAALREGIELVRHLLVASVPVQMLMAAKKSLPNVFSFISRGRLMATTYRI